MNQEVVVFTWTCRACQWTRHAPEAEQEPVRCPQCGKPWQIERVLSVPVRRGDSDPVVRQLRDLTREVEKGRQSLERYLGLHEPAVPDEVVRELEKAALECIRWKQGEPYRDPFPLAWLRNALVAVKGARGEELPDPGQWTQVTWDRATLEDRIARNERRLEEDRKHLARVIAAAEGDADQAAPIAPPRSVVMKFPDPPVPDEVVRELEEAVEELIAWSDGPYVGDTRVSVELGRWRRLKAALGEATKARRKGSKDDADGAILVRDSSPISGQSGRSKAHRWLPRWGDAPLRYECEKCGETSIAGPGSALHSGPCPGKRTPTGSGPTPS